jgi:hypothetical protein
MEPSCPGLTPSLRKEVGHFPHTGKAWIPAFAGMTLERGTGHLVLSEILSRRRITVSSGRKRDSRGTPTAKAWISAFAGMTLERGAELLVLSETLTRRHTTVSSGRKRESRGTPTAKAWIPAFAGMTSERGAGRVVSSSTLPHRHISVSFPRRRESIFTPVFCEPPSELSGSFPAWAGNCLTEPGIVCFPVAPRPKPGPLFDSSDGEALRGRRRSFGAPCRERPGKRPPSLNLILLPAEPDPERFQPGELPCPNPFPHSL